VRTLRSKSAARTRPKHGIDIWSGQFLAFVTVVIAGPCSAPSVPTPGMDAARAETPAAVGGSTYARVTRARARYDVHLHRRTNARETARPRGRLGARAVDACSRGGLHPGISNASSADHSSLRPWSEPASRKRNEVESQYSSRITRSGAPLLSPAFFTGARSVHRSSCIEVGDQVHAPSHEVTMKLGSLDPCAGALPASYRFCVTFVVAGERMFRAFATPAARELYVSAVLRPCASDIQLYEFARDRMPS
jgi:hypothetical protein